MFEFLESKPGTPEWDFSDEEGGSQIRKKKKQKKLSIDAMDGITIVAGSEQKPQAPMQKTYFGQGTKLAKDVGEFFLLKTRLETTDKKKVQQLREQFILDCHYNVATFQVEVATERFANDARNAQQLVSNDNITANKSAV